MPRLGFGVALDAPGTPFQSSLGELRRITPGTTASYAQVAERIGRPKAVRAVARANGGIGLRSSSLPRVIGADEARRVWWGVWRKVRLLEHEDADGWCLRVQLNQLRDSQRGPER